MRFIAAAVGLVVAGCGGASWTIVKRPNPSPVRAATTFTVRPIDFSGVSVDGKPEAEWRAARPPEKGKSWDEDKAVANQNYLNAIAAAPKHGRTFVASGGPPDAPVIVLRVGNVHSANFQLTMQITAPSGDVLEEATMTLKSRGFGIGDQLRSGGEKMAEAVADYFGPS